MEEKLTAYFREKFAEEVTAVEELGGGNFNHKNYKVKRNEKIYVARVGLETTGLLGNSNLSDEYTILKLVEKFNIAPKAFSLDLEGFDVPILVEEFLDATPYQDFTTPTDEMFEKAIDLIVKVSNLEINADIYPFKFSCSSFSASFKTWSLRMSEISRVIGEDHPLVKDFTILIDEVKEILYKKESLLKSAPKEFIYNDIHAENMFLDESEGIAKFIDWQKVSVGNPAFMPVVFVRRCSKIWNMTDSEFSKKVLIAYKSKKSVVNLDELFYLVMLERSVSDMIWSVWSHVRKGESAIGDNGENKYYVETKEWLNRTRSWGLYIYGVCDI